MGSYKETVCRQIFLIIQIFPSKWVTCVISDNFWFFPRQSDQFLCRSRFLWWHPTAEDAAQSYEVVPLGRSHFFGLNLAEVSQDFSDFSIFYPNLRVHLRVKLFFIQFWLEYIVLHCKNARAPWFWQYYTRLHWKRHHCVQKGVRMFHESNGQGAWLENCSCSCPRGIYHNPGFTIAEAYTTQLGEYDVNLSFGYWSLETSCFSPARISAVMLTLGKNIRDCLVTNSTTIWLWVWCLLYPFWAVRLRTLPLPLLLTYSVHGWVVGSL